MHLKGSSLVLLLAQVLTIARNVGGSTQSPSDPTTELKDIVADLAKQVQLQQFALEERTRLDGGSGLKQQRTSLMGSRPYNTQTHTGFKCAAIHDHTNNRNTVGMGEATFVMNGVEFRTRHNDYPLYMPHPTSPEYNKAQEIPFPQVPPEVLAKTTVPEQVEEMKEWFQAWATQDPSGRDYRKYFKPVLCYLEAGWTAESEKLEEAYYSDRHFVDADTWTDLQAKVRYNAYMGRKNNQENYAFLPRTIINITASGMPVYAQWNYRILCHPLKDDLPLDHLVLEDDLQARVIYKKSFHDWAETRGARYRLEGPYELKYAGLTHLDKLMQEVPGRDNYQGHLTETSLGEIYTDPVMNNGSRLNVAYFNRRYDFGQKDASGLKSGKRGFSDPSLFVAETTQEKIAPVYVRICDLHGSQCYEAKKRVTYALPLEIIYLTPIHRWNPYNISFVSTQEAKRLGGNGGLTKDTAFKAASQTQYYMTPIELFAAGDGSINNADPADTTVPMVGVLDGQGVVRKVMASGVRIHLPPLEGVGQLRTRYPIMPVHAEASSVWKELNSLKDIVMNLRAREQYLYLSLPTVTGGSKATIAPNKAATTRPAHAPISMIELNLTKSTVDGHNHQLNITWAQRQTIIQGLKSVSVRTTTVQGHSHFVKIIMYGGRFQMVQADGASLPTADGHDNLLEWNRLIHTDGSVTYRNGPGGKRRRRRRRRRGASDVAEEGLSMDFDMDGQEMDDPFFFL